MITRDENRLLTVVGICAAVLAVALVVLAVVEASSARVWHSSTPVRWSWSWQSSSWKPATSGPLFFAQCSVCHSVPQPTAAAAPADAVAAVTILGVLGGIAALMVAALALRARRAFSRRLSTLMWAIAGLSVAAALTQAVLTQTVLRYRASSHIATLVDPVWGLVGLVVVAALAACVAGILFGVGTRLQRETAGLV